MPSVQTVSFSITGEFVTRHARDLWGEGAFTRAFKILDCMIGMSRQQQIEIIEGRAKLTGTNELDFEPDDWQKPDEYPDFFTAIERAESADFAELERLRKEKASDLLRNAAILTHPGRWSDSTIMSKTDEMIREAERLIGRTNAQELLDEIRDEIEPGVDFDEDEEIGKQRVSRLLGGVPEERQAFASSRPDPIAKLYAQAQNQMAQAALMRGVPTDAIPSADAIQNRGFDLKPELDPTMSSRSGWLLPDGKFYKCGPMEHIGLADTLLAESNPGADNLEKLAESLGWVKISHSITGFHVSCQKKPTRRQQTKLFDYAEKHGQDYNEITRRLGLGDD